jgi:hypothetical protein
MKMMMVVPNSPKELGEPLEDHYNFDDIEG